MKITRTFRNATAALSALAAIGTTTAGAAAAGAIAVRGGSPTRAETAAVTRALGEDGADVLPISVGHVDLNGDHRPDLIYFSESQDYCGALGCSSGAVLATPRGYAARAIQLATSVDTMFVLPTVHNGMHDIRYGNSRHVFVWDGRQYR